jgi:hypothetical protein
MKYGCAAVVLLSLIVSLAATRAGAADLPENLLADPGLEQVSSKTNLPEDWKPRTIGTAAEIVADSSVKHSGRYSVRISAPQVTRSYIVSKTIAVAPGETIRAGAWIKLKDVPTESGTVIVIAGWTYANGNGEDVAKFDVAQLSGPESKDWQLVSGSLKVPPLAAFVHLRIGMSYSKGTVWIDDAFVNAETPLAIRTDVSGIHITPASSALPVSILNRTGEKGRVQVRVSLDKDKTALELPLTGQGVQTVNVPLRINDRGKGKLDVAILRAGSKKVLFKEEREVVVPKALTLSPPIPTHWAIEDGPPKISGDVDLEVPESERKDGSLHVSLVDAAGKAHAMWSNPPTNGWTTFELNPAALPEGSYKMVAEFKPKTGKPTRVEQNFGVIPRRLAKVTINKAGYPEYDGKAIFPMGIFNGGRFEEQAKAGFTVTHAYNAVRITPGERPDDAKALDFLEGSGKHGLKCVFMVPLRLAYTGDWEGFRRRIRMFRNHPALLAWDEEESIARGDASFDVVAKMRDVLREEDPNHPFMIGDARAPISQVDRSNLFPAELMDLGMWWWYPIPIEPKKANALEGEDATKSYEMAPPTFLTQRKTDKPVWVGVQSYRKGTPPRFPTPTEYRAQPYIAVINGAKGIMWYGGSVTGGMFALSKNGKQSDDDTGTPNDKDAHWDYVKILARELHDLSEVFMAPTEEAPALSPAGALISVCIKRAPGRLVMLAVNRDNRPADVAFTSPHIRAGTVTVVAEGRTTPASAGQLKDHFEPYAVHVYELPK